MRVGIDSYSYHRLFGLRRPGEEAVPTEWPRGWERVVAEARRLDVDVLALQTMFLPDPGNLRAEALRAAAGPMELVLSWGGAEGLRFGADPAAAEDLHRWIEVGAWLGAAVVRIVVGGPALRGVEPVGRQMSRVAPVLRRAADAAAAVGVALAVENHGDLTVPELAELLDGVGRGDVGVCLDVANVMRLGGDPVAGVRRLGNRVRMVHLRDCDDPTGADAITGPPVRPYGQGVIPIDAVLDELSTSAASAPICVELAQLGPGADERAIVAASVQWLRRRVVSVSAP